MIPETAPADEIGALLNITGRRVRQIAAERGIAAAGRNKFPIAPLIQAALAQAQEARDPGPLAEARARAIAARARVHELQAAKLDGELIDMSEHLAVVDTLTGHCLDALIGLPARLSRDPRERRRIEAVIDDVRKDVAEKLAKIAPEWPTAEADLPTA